MIGMIPIIVTGGVVKSFSESFFGSSERPINRSSKPRKKKVTRNSRRTGFYPTKYPSGYQPF